MPRLRPQRSHVALLALTALVATAALIAGAVRTPDRASAQEPQPGLAAVPGSVVAVERDISLLQGWNLVGWANDAPVADAADPIAASISRIFDFNERDKTFRFYDDASPSFLNTLTTLRAGHGLWVFATQDTTWQAPAFPLNDPQPLLLTTGFNLVTWQGPSGIAAGDAFAAIAAALDGAWTWDPSVQRFQTYRPGQPAFLNDLTTLEHGQALWILARSGATWTQPDAGAVVVADDQQLVARVLPGSAADHDGITVTSIPTSGLPAAFDGLTVVAAYELAWSGPADAPLSVEYVTPGDLAVAQAEDQGTLEISDPGLVLLTLQDGQAVPVGDQTLTITDDASSVAGALPPDAQFTVAQNGTSDDRNGGFLIVTDLNEVFRIRQLDFPAGGLVTFGFSQPLRVAVFNLSPAKPLTDVSAIAWTSLGQEHLLPRGVPGELPDLLKRPQWIEPDIPPNGAAGVLERLRDKVCASTGLVTYTWVAVGRAPLAPDGEFAEFVRGFSVRRDLSFVCGPPRISLEVTYSGFELDTHFYAFELDSPGGTPVPEADYAFETIDSYTGIGCGRAVSPADFSFAGFNFDSPAMTFGYLHKGCLDAAVEAATRIGVRFDYMPTVLGYRIRCTFSHSQTAFEFVGQGRGRLGGSGFSDWSCDPVTAPQ